MVCDMFVMVYDVLNYHVLVCNICAMMDVDKNGWNPFCVACQKGYEKVLDWMLSHGLHSSEMTHEGKCFVCKMMIILFECSYKMGSSLIQFL